MSILEQAHAIREQIVADRRHIHQNPELGLELDQTAAYVTKRLKEMGYEPKPCGKNGVVATIGTGGKTILLRADMDALPILEDSGEAFCSVTNGRAHCCGHDLHTSMLLGAAKLLKDNESKLQGTVKFMFQPGEEIFAGAKSMIEDGLFTDSPVDAAIGMHVFPSQKIGTICHHKGALMASVDGFKIHIKGMGCHGAQSFAGIDPINIGIHIHLALQEVIAREIDSNETALITIGQFTAGQAANIIPETAMMQGTLRTFSNDVRDFMVKRLHEICESVAKTYRGSVEVEMLYEIPTNYCNEEMTTDVVSYIENMNAEVQNSSVSKIIQEESDKIQGSEDFALVAATVPSTFLLLGANFPEGNKVDVIHNPKVVFNEDCLPIGAAAYASCAIQWLENHK
jgi:amidohydrolase